MPAKMLRNNFPLKFGSLLLAVALWVYINGELKKAVEKPVVSYKDIKGIEVKLLGEALVLGKNMVIVDLERRSVDVRVKGPQPEVVNLSSVDIIAYVDVSGLKPGRVYNPVVNFVLPRDIELAGAPPLLRVEIKDKTF